LSLSSPSILSVLSFDGKVVVVKVVVERAEAGESQEAGEALVVLVGRVLLAAQVLQNPRHHTVAEVVNRRPFLQVNCLLDVYPVEALDLRFMETGSLSFANMALFVAHIFFFISRQYGSGYPGVAGRGVAGRGFPFVFWPLAWGGVAGVSTAAYLHNTEVD
jgi:hypothetical protein